MCSRHPLRRPRGRHRLQRKVGTGIELPFVVYAESYSCGGYCPSLAPGGQLNRPGFLLADSPSRSMPCGA